MADGHKFDVLPSHRFATGTSVIKRPKEIAYFSYDENHQFRLDDSSLRYYHTPPIGANLSAGFDTFRQLDDAKDEHIDALLATVMDLERRTGKRCESDVITWRGMMTKIMSAPCDRFNSIQMNATLFQGTIFIEEDNTAKLAERQQQHGTQQNHEHRSGPSQDLMSYWGYKFETLSLIPAIWDATSREYIEGREQEVVSNYAQYCSVVSTKIGSVSLIIGGEVDAVWDQKPADPEQPINWVELKTTQEIRSAADSLKFERKLCKFWIQSFLLGVPKIIVGFRSREGILQHVEELQTQRIPGDVKRKGSNSWDGNLCINFAAQFLAFLKETITTDGVWKIRRHERSPAIEVVRSEVTGTGRIISKEFLEWREQLYAREVADML